MAEFNVIQSTDFSINELVIVSKYGRIDISAMFEEINIYDSIMSPCVTGSIVITDAIGLSDKLLFDGTEILLVDIDKGGNYFPLKRSFRIYKQSNRKNINMTSETYVLHFASEELIYSNQQKISRSYNTTYAEMAVSILNSDLGVPIEEFKGLFNSSLGVKKVIIPNLPPLESIQWIAKRAIDDKNSPTFLFFQNNEGYNFCTISSMMEREPLFTVNFGAKNLTDNIGTEIVGARDVRVVTQFDFLKNTKAGVYSGTFFGFDPVTRTSVRKTISFGDHYENSSHANDNPNLPYMKNRLGYSNMQMNNSRQSFYLFQTNQANSDYIKQKDPTSLQKEDDTIKYVFQRKALFQNLLGQRIRVVLPGNFVVSSGFTLNLEVPKRAFKAENDDAFDMSLYGKYLIVATRHIIKYNMHETIVDVVTDSTQKEFVASSEQQQKQYRDNY